MNPLIGLKLCGHHTNLILKESESVSRLVVSDSLRLCGL